MRYLIIAFSFLSIVIGQQTDIQSSQVEIVDYDDNGRVVSSRMVGVQGMETQVSVVEDQSIEVYNGMVEIIEYDTEGRITSTRMVKREEITESLDEIQLISDIYDGQNIEYQYDDNGRVVN